MGATSPLKQVMHITHHGRSDAVTRVLADFGSEDSFGQAAKRFAEHYHYALHSSTVSRVTKHVADDAVTDVEQRLSRADEQERDIRGRLASEKRDCQKYETEAF